MASLQLQKVKEFLSCAVCYDTFTDPCTLYCQHTFCRKCIASYLNTRPDAVRAKLIPCPSCRQYSKVPFPAQPVAEWVKQIKPSIIIVGLLDTSPTCDDAERCCVVCRHLGETTPASSWCQECEMNLCERCTKAHHLNVGSRDHEVCELSEKVKIKKKHKRMCGEHKKNVLEFHCEDCLKPACQSCCVLYHRACHSVVTIESMKPEMVSKLEEVRGDIGKHLEHTTTEVERVKTNINEVSQKTQRTKSQIKLASQSVVDKIREQERQLIDKVEHASRIQMNQLRAEKLTHSVQMQTYKQHCEYIDQAVSNDDAFGMYEMFQMCKSKELTEFVKDPMPPKRRSIEDITFVEDKDAAKCALDQLELGEIKVTHQTENGTETETWNATEIDLMDSPTLCDVIDIRTADNKTSPDVIDITVLDVQGKQVVVVTDWGDDSLKSFYTVNNVPQCSALPLDKRPSGMTQHGNQVLVSVMGSQQIVTVHVGPELVQTSSMSTEKLYMSLASINSSSFAAGCSRPVPCVDVLSMTGHVVMSISTYNNELLFRKPVYMCMNKGNIMVSDWDKQCVTCLATTGEVLWRYSPANKMTLKRAYGIAATRRGEVFVADKDSDKVILLSTDGESVRDLLTKENGINQPRGIAFDESRGCLYVTEENDAGIKEFIFGIDA